MNSTVTLYYSCLVEKDKNFRLDGSGGANAIATYLSTLTSKVISDFQYVKHALALSIKIDSAQANLDMGASTYDLNYCKIQNGSENPFYYFILSKNWKSRNTIELVLAMDTLNTFTYDVDYVVDKKTFIKRMHKPRFTNTAPESQNDNIVKKIDLKSEDIPAPTYKVSETTLFERDGKSMIDWCLYYKTANNQQGTPIDAYLVPSDPVELVYQGNAGEFDTGNVPEDEYLLFFIAYNTPAITFDVDGATYSPSDETRSAYGHSARYIYAVALFNDNNVMKVLNGYFYKIDNNAWAGSWYTVANSPTSIKVLNAPETVYSYQVAALPTAAQIASNSYWNASWATHTTSMGALVQGLLNGQTSIDKTLEENIKIINIPYSPTPFSVNTYEEYKFDDCWKYNVGDGTLKLVDFSKRFKNPITSNGKDFYGNFYYKITNYNMFNGTRARFLEDPKLLHSDFYKPKFVYDSFSKTFAMEQIKAMYKALYDGKFRFDFVMSRNLVSKFLFKFDYEYDHATDDYENIVAVSRNNEEVLYNSQYLNYIRTGYNYDLKSKERQEAAGIAGVGLTAAGFLASLGIGFATGNPIALGSAVATGISLVSQLVNYAKTTAQTEENIQRKLQESQRQAISVLNADDYDLLYEYSLNKAKLVEYRISDQMKSALDDLFYYGGYIVNEQGKPETRDRYWFNFVQADLVISETNNLTDEIISDIKEKFSNGVTFLHYKIGTFDLAQEKENFETFLYRR